MTNTRRTTVTERMLARIDAVPGVEPHIRYIAKKMLREETWLFADEDEAEEDKAYMSAMRQPYSVASERDLTRAHCLLVAVAESLKPR